MAVVVLGLEVLIKPIGIDEEYNMGSSVGSFDGINYGKTCGLIYGESFEYKSGCRCGEYHEVVHEPEE